MAITLRPRRRTKLQRAKQAVTALAAFRALRTFLRPRRIAFAGGAAALSMTAIAIAKRRSGAAGAPVPGAPATEAAAPVPPQNGASAPVDPATEARSAAASVSPGPAA
jgi:hypothetical protein